MAARVLLLAILFTEVVEPVCTAGARGAGNNLSGKNGSKGDGVEVNWAKSSSLRLEPGGHVVLGKKGVTLNCVSGNNQEISWLYNDESAPPCGIARCVRWGNGSLHFKRPNLQKTKNVTNDPKQHEYRCIGRTNSGGLLRSAPTFLQFAELSHTFKQPPVDSTVHEGEIARLSCLIDSVPYPPNITWHHNGQPILSAHNKTKYFMISPGVLYIIATKQSDAGSYRCIATNDLLKKTKKSKEAKLIVIPNKQRQKIPASLFPQISYSHSLISGSNLSVVCATSGLPAPLITWSFVPRYSDGKARIILNSTSGISLLALSNISVSDAGTYLCSAKNVVSGGMEIQNITLDVMVPPSFIKRPKNQIYPNGRTARFECQVDGVPTPKIYWLKDSKNVKSEGRRTTYMKENNKMELAISATVPADSGDYQCVATNSAGEIWASGRLQVNSSRKSPAVPTALRCYTQSPVKMILSWIPPESLPPMSITAYTVHYRPSEGGKEEISLEPGNSTSVELTKLLEPFTNYSFYVRVWNNHGASDQSATVVCETAPSVPIAAPRVHVDVLTADEANVTWEPLSRTEARGIIVQYKIQWKIHEHPSSQVDFTPADTRHYLLTNLLPGAQYDVRVLARTEKGWPDISEHLSWETFIMPTSNVSDLKIRNLVDIQLINVNSTHLKLTWRTKPTADKVKFDSWQIYSEYLNGDKLWTERLSANSTEYLLTNLEPNVSYNIGLCIINKNSSRDCLSKTVKSIGHTSSGVPLSLEAVPLSPTSMQITWTMLNKTAIDKFEVCYEASDTGDSTECIVVNETKAIVSNLTPFTLYQFKVRYFQRDFPATEFSDSIECFTSEDVPGAPENVQALQNSSRIEITWKKPNKSNGKILAYFVSYYTSDIAESTTTWGNATVPGNRTSVVVSGLRVDSGYFITVQAATKAGYGKPSSPILLLAGSNFKAPTSSDKREPPAKVKPDQSLGVILGLSISIGFIIISLCSIYCRKKWEHSRSLRETSQPLKTRVLMRNGKACCVDRSSTSTSQPTNNQTTNEIELAVLCPSSPTSINQDLDTKGALCNGLVEACAKDPLLSPWNNEEKDLNITKISQYKKQGSSFFTKTSGEADEEEEEEEENEQDVDRADADEDSEDVELDTTKLTTVDCTFIGSTSSLNNNVGCSVSPGKIVPPVVPVLEPNG